MPDFPRAYDHNQVKENVSLTVKHNLNYARKECIAEAKSVINN